VRKAVLLEMKGAHPHLRNVAVDPWNATGFTQQLMADGVPVVEVRQGYQSLSAPAKLFEALVMDGLLRHDGNPCMAWCVENTELARDSNGNIRPVRPKARHKRIDGMAALVTGLSQLMVQPLDVAKRANLAAIG
jgi:phage terminase large subunit-like protein